ncbi:MAG: DUF5939 domain-containing protein [Acidobacteriota bacterium]|nr:DUF5939 domain-containing protein [Acidobacteriota bacterium]
MKTLAGLREYLLLPGEPDTRLNPKWLARRLGVPVRELLGALAYAVRNGLVEMSWEVYCPVCGRSPWSSARSKKRTARLNARRVSHASTCTWTPARDSLTSSPPLP